MHTTFRIRFPISFWNLTDKKYIALAHKEQWQLLNNTGQSNLEKCSVNMPGTFSCKKDDLIWLWVSQGMQLIMCDDAIYSVLPVQIQWYTKEAGLLLGWDFTRQFRNSGWVQVQEEELRPGSSPWGDVKAEAPGRRWARPAQPRGEAASLLWAVSLCSLAITCAQIATTGNMQWFICPCNYCNCDHSCGNGTGKQSITHPDWEVAHPPLSLNSISSYTLLAEQTQQDVLSQCSPVQCHSVLLWQRNKLLSLIRHFPSVPQHGAFWRQRRR